MRASRHCHGCVWLRTSQRDHLPDFPYQVTAVTADPDTFGNQGLTHFDHVIRTGGHCLFFWRQKQRKRKKVNDSEKNSTTLLKTFWITLYPSKRLFYDKTAIESRNCFFQNSLRPLKEIWLFLNKKAERAKQSVLTYPHLSWRQSSPVISSPSLFLQTKFFAFVLIAREYSFNHLACEQAHFCKFGENFGCRRGKVTKKESKIDPKLLQLFRKLQGLQHYSPENFRSNLFFTNVGTVLIPLSITFLNPKILGFLFLRKTALLGKWNVKN